METVFMEMTGRSIEEDEDEDFDDGPEGGVGGTPAAACEERPR